LLDVASVATVADKLIDSLLQALLFKFVFILAQSLHTSTQLSCESMPQIALQLNRALRPIDSSSNRVKSPFAG
jgi:hypothetical protein